MPTHLAPGRHQPKRLVSAIFPEDIAQPAANMTMTSSQSISVHGVADRSAAVVYRNVKVDGLSIFYREVGRPEAPTVLLLHGFPSSSRMFEPLFTRLSGDFHLVAPDYPGFGHSDAPDAKGFAYTFDHIAKIVDRFTEISRT